jgi:hypothetical protein
VREQAFQIEATTDVFIVRHILTHPKIYRRASDDFALPVGQFQPAMQGIVYVLLKCNGLHMGLWGLCPHSKILWEVHTCLLPQAWGETARAAVPHFLQWVWDNTPCKRIITSVPHFNRAALKFALGSGMTEYGLNPGAFQKWGKLYDVHMLGLSRPED